MSRMSAAPALMYPCGVGIITIRILSSGTEIGFDGFGSSAAIARLLLLYIGAVCRPQKSAKRVCEHRTQVEHGRLIQLCFVFVWIICELKNIWHPTKGVFHRRIKRKKPNIPKCPFL